MKQVLKLILFSPIICFSQVVIHDEPDTTGSHPVLVKQRLEATILQYKPLPFIHYSQNYNVGEDFPPDVISNHSYAWGNLVGGVNNYAKNILNVVAHGANVNIEISGYPDNEPWIRVAAVSPDTTNNNTSYGSGLDFVERTDDTPFVCATPCQSSATPKVTGKLFVIKHRVDSICFCNTDWFNIYVRARETASNGGVWDERTGYGIINVSAAVAYAGSYPVNDWVDYEVPESMPDPPSLGIDSFPRKTALTGTELFKTYRNEVNGYNSEFTAETLKKYVLTTPIWLNSAQTVGIFTGTGSPEGVVTASVGSTYHRTDGGAGTSFYIKESGSGSTGWVAK